MPLASAGTHYLRHLQLTAPEEWRSTIVDAVKSAGSVEKAADDLDISFATLYRMVKRDARLKRLLDLPGSGRRAAVG